jgi:hypothetical protein
MLRALQQDYGWVWRTVTWRVHGCRPQTPVGQNTREAGLIWAAPTVSTETLEWSRARILPTTEVEVAGVVRSR